MTTKPTQEDVIIEEKDLSNFIRTFIRGYRFLHGNNDPRKVIIPKVLFVDKVLVEYETAKTKEKKDVKP